jgi:hypothetical protein
VGWEIGFEGGPVAEADDEADLVALASVAEVAAAGQVEDAVDLLL